MAILGCNFQKRAVACPKKMWYYDNSKVYLYKYEQPKFHINGYEMRNHIDNSQLIKL